MSNENVQTITAGQMFELGAMCVKAMPKLSDMPFETAKRWIGDQQGFVEVLRSTLMPVSGRGAAPNFAAAYHALGMDQEYADLLTIYPQQSLEGYWSIPVLTGVTPNAVVQALRTSGVAVWTYAGDLDKSVTVNDRDPSHASYWISCKATVEADENLKNLSGRDICHRNIAGITLLERLLLELAYYLTTDEHLDVKNVTLCAGSRDSDGHVPDVDWDSGDRRVEVYWSYPYSRYGKLRARAVRQ